MKNFQVLNTFPAKSYSANNYLFFSCLLLTPSYHGLWLHLSSPFSSLNDIPLLRLIDRNTIYLFKFIPSSAKFSKMPMLVFLIQPFCCFFQTLPSDLTKSNWLSLFLGKVSYFRNLFLTYCVPLWILYPGINRIPVTFLGFIMQSTVNVSICQGMWKAVSLLRPAFKMLCNAGDIMGAPECPTQAIMWTKCPLPEKYHGLEEKGFRVSLTYSCRTIHLFIQFFGYILYGFFLKFLLLIGI